MLLRANKFRKDKESDCRRNGLGSRIFVGKVFGNYAEYLHFYPKFSYGRIIAEESPDPVAPAKLDRARGQIAFENVSFGYEPDRILMKNISFTAQPGQKIAIVGSTGAGKTTLVNLLMRFYAINNGKITVDGLNTAEMSRSGLRRNFGMVLQDSCLPKYRQNDWRRDHRKGSENESWQSLCVLLRRNGKPAARI